MVKSYANYTSTYEDAKIRYIAIDDELVELKNEYIDIVGEPYEGLIHSGYTENNKVVGIVENIERLELDLAQTQAKRNSA
jgi:hypothetical protein